MSVFYSHAWADKPFVAATKHALDEYGVGAWLDTEQMQAGDALFAKISEGIDDCVVFLAFVSPAYLNSENCKKELMLATSWNKPCIFLRLPGIVEWPPRPSTKYSFAAEAGGTQEKKADFASEIAPHLGGKLYQICNHDSVPVEELLRSLRERGVSVKDVGGSVGGGAGSVARDGVKGVRISSGGGLHYSAGGAAASSAGGASAVKVASAAFTHATSPAVTAAASPTVMPPRPSVGTAPAPPVTPAVATASPVDRDRGLATLRVAGVSADTITKVLREFSTDAGVCAEAARVLTNVTLSAVDQQAAVNARATDAIVSTLRAHPSAVDVALYGSWALSNIASIQVGQQAAVDSGAPAVVVSTLRAHAGNANVGTRGCFFFANVAALPAGQQAAVDARAPEAVVAALRAHVANADVAHRGIWALASIATITAGQQAAVDARAPAAVVAAMRAHVGDANVAHRGCFFLANVAALPAGQQAAVDARAPEAVVAALRAHVANADIAHRGCCESPHFSAHSRFQDPNTLNPSIPPALQIKGRSRRLRPSRLVSRQLLTLVRLLPSSRPCVPMRVTLTSRTEDAFSSQMSQPCPLVSRQRLTRGRLKLSSRQCAAMLQSLT